MQKPGQDSIAERFGALAELRDAGLIRHLGLSNVRLEHLEEARTVAPIVCVQNNFALDAYRDDEVVLEKCAARVIAFVPFFALAGRGREAGASDEHADAVRAIADAHDATPHQVRLAWTLHQGPHVLALPGTGSVAHLEENVAAGALRLTDDELAGLG